MEDMHKEQEYILCAHCHNAPCAIPALPDIWINESLCGSMITSVQSTARANEDK